MGCGAVRFGAPAHCNDLLPGNVSSLRLRVHTDSDTYEQDLVLPGEGNLLVARFSPDGTFVSDLDGKLFSGDQAVWGGTDWTAPS